MSGYLQYGLEFYSLPSLSTSYTAQHPFRADRGLLDSSSPISGGKTYHTAHIHGASLSGSARAMFSFYDDFYNAVYLTPPIVDFGAISSGAEIDVQIWNAFTTPTTLTSINQVEANGVTFSGVVLPQTFAPLQQITLTVSASPSGAPSARGTFELNFSQGGERDLAIFGDRSRIWPLLPDWGDNVEVSYEYLTEVITSRTHREQRLAQRATPRKRITFSSLALNGQLANVRRLLSAWMGNIWVVPEYTRTAKTSGMAASGHTTVVDAAPAWLVPGQTVALRYNKTIETRTVQTVTGNTVTFLDASATGWPVGTLLHPALSCTLSAAANDMQTNLASRFNLQFDELPASAQAEPRGAASTTFKGREVWLKSPDWGQAITIDYAPNAERLDFQHGRISLYHPAPFDQQDYKAVFVAFTQAQAEDILNFFHRLRGQQGEFYRPSMQPDLTPKTVALAGTSALRFEGHDMLDYEKDKINRAVYIRLADGSVVMNRLLTVGRILDLTGDDTQFLFEDPWPVPIDPATARISWMPVCRLASDTATSTWATDQVCNIQFTFRLCEALTAETL